MRVREETRHRGRDCPPNPVLKMKAQRFTFSAASGLALGSLAVLVGCADVPVRQSTLETNLSAAGGIDGSFVPPTAIRMVEPFYPIEMKLARTPGRVRVTALVDETGRVQDPKLESASHAAFGASALEAVGQWRFKPALRDGVPVATRVSLPLNFSVEE